MKVVFPKDPTAMILARLLNAGEGAELHLRLRSSKDGTGITLYADVRAAADVSKLDEECEEPINSSHVCPGPLCPTP